MKFRVEALLLLTVLFWASCSKEDVGTKAADSSPTEVAVSPFREPQPVSKSDLLAAEWNGGKIYLSQLDNMLGARFDSIVDGSSDPIAVSESLFDERTKVLNLLVENYLLIQEAHARKLQLSESQKEQILKGARANFNTREEYEENLRTIGQTEEEFLQVLVNIHLGQKCVENERDAISEKMTPDTLREYYNSHIDDRFTPPARSDLNWVVIKENAERTLEQARDLAKNLHDEIADGVRSAANLEAKRKYVQDCAYSHSDDFTGKYNYGNVNLYHGVSGWEKYDAEFRREISKRDKPGELSDVVKINDSSYGFFLVYNYHASFVSQFESKGTQDMLPNMFIQEKLEAWRDELKEKYGLKVNQENLSTIPGLNPSTEAR